MCTLSAERIALFFYIFIYLLDLEIIFTNWDWTCASWVNLISLIPSRAATAPPGMPFFHFKKQRTLLLNEGGLEEKNPAGALVRQARERLQALPLLLAKEGGLSWRQHRRQLKVRRFFLFPCPPPLSLKWEFWFPSRIWAWACRVLRSNPGIGPQFGTQNGPGYPYFPSSHCLLQSQPSQRKPFPKKSGWKPSNWLE